MSRGLKVLGPANDADTPEDEIHLAMLIQNAASRGLRSCRFDFALAVDGRDAYRLGGCTALPAEILPNAIAVCVRGAMALELDTRKLDNKYGGAATGNNVADDFGAHLAEHCVSSGFNIGAAFEHALRPGTQS